MKQKQSYLLIGILMGVMLIFGSIPQVSATQIESNLSEQTDSKELIALPITEANIEAFDQDSRVRCPAPDALTEISGLAIDPSLVNATPYWIYLAAGKKEQNALMDFITKSDVPKKKKTEWIRFLRGVWKKYPLKFERNRTKTTLGLLKPIKEYSLTRQETASFEEIEKMIAIEMKKTSEQEVGVRWYFDQHQAFMNLGLSNEDYIHSDLKTTAIDNAPIPDGWYSYDPTGILVRSMNHGYLVTQYSSPIDGLGLAPQNFGTYALSAKAKYILHDYNGAFTDIGYSSHFITDLGQPFHTPNAILAVWPSYDDPFSTESKIVRYKTLHDQYEDFVASYWSQSLPNGRTFSDYANSATGATIIIEPTTSAKYHALASNVASIPLYYACNWHYIIYKDYEFQKNPAIIALTRERVVATTENTRGLVRFVTGSTPQTLTITANAGEHGSINPAGSVSVNYGESKSFAISPESGFTIDQIIVDNSPVTQQNPYLFDDVRADHTIAVTFKPETSPTITWTWASDGWGDWQHDWSVSGTQVGPNSEYGPVMVGEHGEHGTNTNLLAGSTQSRIWRTFTDTSGGGGWNTITFTGAIAPCDVPDGRWITIEVNGQQVFGATEVNNPPGNTGQPFTVTGYFTPATSAEVKISQGQSPAWGPRFPMSFYSVTLSNDGTTSLVRTASTPFTIPNGKDLITNETFQTN